MNDSIPAKKSLGQNFLKSKVALAKMIEVGEISKNDLIVEVGPGKGVLTEQLLLKAKKVIAIEKDRRLIELLNEKFKAEIDGGKLELQNIDILETKTADYLSGYKIIANIPYYITGQFLRKFLETDNQPERIVVMVQKEIAQRIVAKGKNGGDDGKESLLSISVKAYGEPKNIMKVGKENFSPAPKVDSAILAINNISKKFFVENNISEQKFFEILHAGFAHKRKVLISNLKTIINKNKLTDIFNQLQLTDQVRAEDLSLNDWLNLVRRLSWKHI